MGKRKFKFVEEFIDPSTGQLYPDTGSPKVCTTIHFGKFQGHQIAKIEWVKKIVKRRETSIDADGNTIQGEEKEVEEYEEHMGERGGWIESIGNLSQSGSCWVKPGGYVLGESYVSGDAEIAGEVGESAKVYGEAKVKSGAGVGGSAAVFGKAEISSTHAGGAVIGNAKVGGEAKVRGTSVVNDSAYVMGSAVVEGQAVVEGIAKILGEGKVSDSASVKDNVVVYGEVSGNASVNGNAFIMRNGVVKGNATVGGAAIVNGTIEGKATVSNGQPFIGKNGIVRGESSVISNTLVDSTVVDCSLGGNSSIVRGGVVGKGTRMIDNATAGGHSKAESKNTMSGNAWLDGRVAESSMSGNSSVAEQGNVTRCTINGNGKIISTTSQSEVTGGIVRGGMVQAKVKGGAIVTKSGWVNKGEISDSAIIAGKVFQGKAMGGAIVASNGTVSDKGTAAGNARIIKGTFNGKASDNGCVDETSRNNVSENGILKNKGMDATGNQVYLEDKDGQPGEAAVICKVEIE